MATNNRSYDYEVRPELEWLRDRLTDRETTLGALRVERSKLLAENERLRAALAEAISWSYGEDVTPERREEVEAMIRG